MPLSPPAPHAASRSHDPTADGFIAYWSDKGGSERGNYQKFINQLCALIGTAEPEATSEDERRNDYVYERRVRALDIDGDDGRSNYIDCYKRNSFVLEAKQSRKRQRPDSHDDSAPDLFGGRAGHPPSSRRGGWDRLMRQARAQAERYAKALPPDHGWPPFLLIVDVGHVIETYADFTGLGKHYQPFPDSRSHRIALEDLRDPAIRERLRAVWDAPLTLDPGAHRAEVTRDIAQRLARLARSLEKRYEPKRVAFFLMRCLFTAFAQNVGLLPGGAFLKLLEEARPYPAFLPRYLDPFWRSMDRGNEHDTAIHARVRHFNGGLFRDAEALPLDEDEIGELITACARDWKNVEPAIFGTLLENALSRQERGHYGAHFTPRAYVERVVIPTLMEPLAEDWRTVQAVAEEIHRKDGPDKAIRCIRDFHHTLCNIRILDPACGTGNFLYVALERLKALEGEVLTALEEIGGSSQVNLDLAGHTVGPHQVLGLEKNPRAVPIAELVIWIGHLQCHLRQRGPESLSDPILHSYDTIREGDAILSWTRTEPVLDNAGQPRRRWDGLSRRTDPLTGHDVPDDTCTVAMERFIGAAPAVWPEADFIIGNPPFIAGKDLRAELGDGYAEALWSAYPHMPGGADYVTYWWDKAADAVRTGRARRFGFITTNSITQTFSRRVIQRHLDARPPLHLVFAIPDHPWADGAGSAAVRVAMTAAEKGEGDGVLKTVTAEGVPSPHDGTVPVTLTETRGIIRADLTIGANIAAVRPLRANEKLASRGVSLHGSGFIVTPAEARALGLGTVPGLEQHIRPYRNGRDLTARPRGVMVIDLFGLSEDEVRQRFPAVYQWVYDRLWAERQSKKNTPDGKLYGEQWWIFGKPRPGLRAAILKQNRYIVTVETAKHRIFSYVNEETIPDNKLVVIPLKDSYSLGILSSHHHQLWAIAAGGWLGVGNDSVYVKTRCFDPFPFPAATPHQKRLIGQAAEELDAHRKRVLAAHPTRLTLTELYNVLEKCRAGDTLTARETEIYTLGQVRVIQALHGRIDEAVAEAYGWPAQLQDGEILERLVPLNAERHREEQQGQIRWLRPEYQNPAGTVQPMQQPALFTGPQAPAARLVWPTAPAEQVRSIMSILQSSGQAIAADSLARRFKGARQPRVRELLDILVSIGHARLVTNGHYAA